MKIAITDLPGLSPLAKQYFSDFSQLAEFYNGDYRDAASFRSLSETAKKRELPLGKLIPVLKEQNQRFGCGPQALEKIDWLLERRAAAVVTGQQAGLFGGPLFAIYKALTAIKLAARLSRTCEGCFVPIFWLASDDHDFREINHTAFLNKQAELTTLTYTSHPVDSRNPVSQINLGPEIEDILQKMRDETHPSEFKDDVLNGLGHAYSEGASFSTAFGTWLVTLFKPFGLVVIDASDRRLKQLGCELFGRELSGQSPSTQACLQTTEILQSRGYQPQVQVNPGMSNLFYAHEERQSIEFSGETYRIKGAEQSFTRDQILSEVRENPQHFSPNVLLRPLYQDALLPTVAYVAGPSEIAYYAQMKGIYEEFEMPMPIIYPRKSITLLTGNIAKVLEHFDLGISEFWDNIDTLITRIAKEQLPDTLEKRIENATLCVDKNMQALESVVMEFEPTLKGAVESTRGRISSQIDGLAKKMLQAYKKRNEIIGQQLTKAGNSLYPANQLQERVHNITPYLFKYGFDFIDKLYEAVDTSDFDHQIIEV